MTKLLAKSLVLLSLVFLSLPLTASAESGACSSHGGVNCAYGIDADGSVVCNDGWKESTTSYLFTVMCEDGPSITLTEYIRQGRTVPQERSSYDEAYNSCINSKYKDLNLIDRMNACAKAASVESSKTYCPEYSSVYYDIPGNESTWCVCNEGFYNNGGACQKGSAPQDLNSALAQGVANMNRQLDEMYGQKTNNSQVPRSSNNANNGSQAPSGDKDKQSQTATNTLAGITPKGLGKVLGENTRAEDLPASNTSPEKQAAGFTSFLGFIIGAALLALIVYKAIIGPLLAKFTKLKGNWLYFTAYALSAALLAIFVRNADFLPLYMLCLTGFLFYDLLKKKPPVPEAEKKQA